MKNMYLFPNKEISYEEYLKQVQSVLETITIFNNEECIKGVEALTKITEQEKKDKLISSSILVDETFTIPKENQTNISKKLPIIMTIANFISNHYEYLKDLNDKELMLFGFFTVMNGINDIEQHLSLFADKNLLQVVIEKTDSCYEQLDILGIISDKYYGFGMDKEEKEKQECFKIESIMTIRESTKEELLSMVGSKEQIYEIMDKYNIHI